MKAAWYSRNGEANDVLQVGELPTPEPGPGLPDAVVARVGETSPRRSPRAAAPPSP